VTDPLIGKILGDRYRIEHPIGAGGMGAAAVASIRRRSTSRASVASSNVLSATRRPRWIWTAT
jgi:hypothetical protein